MYLVTKPFNEGDIKRSTGELVTGKGYKLLNRLISLRYLKEVELKKGEETSFECQLCETKRCFINEESLENHYLACHADQVEIIDDNNDSRE